ncbi:MAG: phosphoenolpyruvate carboxykinase (ATP) [Armatimonadetes bacterium]|nr:phosphoenolpyruvate carboxykinase (ATP) [Armatimonadota bacterium]
MKLADPSGKNPSGFRFEGEVHWNLPPAALYEHAIRRHEGYLAAGGALIAITSPHTGRSPRDKFIVREPESESKIWWGRVNQPMGPDHFNELRRHVLSHLQDKTVFVQDLLVGADPTHALPIRIITEDAWQSLFARNLFIRIHDFAVLRAHKPAWTVIATPTCLASPDRHGTRSPTFVVINFAEKLVLIGGTHYAGEIKKSMFTVMNYLLPIQGNPAMHCSANVGQDGRPALFFGLSGTGKTSLSTDPERPLVGDDEHGWTDDGIFNFEGGCYAKTIRLSLTAEPDIYAATHKFGTILENVVADLTTRELDLDDETMTENTRAAYPLTHLSNVAQGGRAGHPTDVVFLAADAFGVMPPIARLTPDQIEYHFLSGYTAKVAGTEKGVVDPEATFSACFGDVFLALHPKVYAEQIVQRIRAHKARAWLINTGWTGGPFGVGHRISIRHTRAIIRAALTGQLDGLPLREDPVFRLLVPEQVPGIPMELLTPRRTWATADSFDAQARRLAGMFVENFKQFEANVEPRVREAGPRAG